MGVFRQKAAATWFRPRPTKLQVTVLIPGPLSVDDWLDKLGTLSHAWPQPHQLRSLQVTRVLRLLKRLVCLLLSNTYGRG